MATSSHMGSSRPGTARVALAIAIGVVIAVGATAAFVVGLKALDADTIRCTAPGHRPLRFESAGKYTLFYEFRSEFEGKRYNTGREWPGYAVSLMKASGEAVDLHPWQASRYSSGGTSGYSLYTFRIPEPGDYVLSAGVPSTPGRTELVLAMKRAFGSRILVAVLIPLAVVFPGVFVILAVLGLLPGRGTRLNADGLVGKNGDDTLMDTSSGFFEGSWRLPLPYEGSLCDRYFGGRVGSRIRCNARLTLTRDAIHIVPWFGDPVSIPLDRVYDTYPCSTVGGKVWGNDRVLKIVWQSDDGAVATGIVTMVGAGINARHWHDAIAPLLPGLPAPPPETVAALRRENRRVTVMFWTIALSPTVLLGLALTGALPFLALPAGSLLFVSFVAAMLVSRWYYRLRREDLEFEAPLT